MNSYNNLKTGFAALYAFFALATVACGYQPLIPTPTQGVNLNDPQSLECIVRQKSPHFRYLGTDGKAYLGTLVRLDCTQVQLNWVGEDPLDRITDQVTVPGNRVDVILDVKGSVFSIKTHSKQ